MTDTNFTGYKGIMCNAGMFVDNDQAYDYAIQHCSDGPDRIAFEKEFKKDITEWYFSGNWVKEE